MNSKLRYPLAALRSAIACCVWITVQVLAMSGCSSAPAAQEDGGACPPPVEEMLACQERGAECGTITMGDVGLDGCSTELHCGECAEPKVCGAVTANRCGECLPKSCGELLPACGTIADGCGRMMHCPCPCTSADDCESKLCLDNWCWKWRALASMPTARTQLSIALSGGKVYAIGGRDAAEQALDTVEVYSPQSDSWSSVANLPTPRAALATAITADGRIFAIGGFRDQPLATVEVYTPASNSWEQVADLGSARAGLSAVVGPNGALYAIGGSTAQDGSSSNPVSTVEEYSTLGDFWVPVGSLARARSDLAAAFSANNLLYAIGGIDAGAMVATIHDSVETFDQNVNQWGPAPPMHSARWGLGACAAQGRIFAVGGYDPDQHFVEVEWLDFGTDDWVTTSAMPTPRWSLGVTCDDTGLFAAGGLKLGSPTADVEFFGP